MFVKLFKEVTSKKKANEDWIEAETARLKADLETKRKAAIERMGTKWILHPDHMVQKKDIEANSLGFKTA